jgi:hypothetical protein
MKKLIILLIIISITSLKAIDWQNLNPEKAVNVDLGVGSSGFSIGAGGRYWIFGASIGFVGLFSNIPSYSYSAINNIYLRPDKPLPQGYVEQRYTALMINADLNIYMDYFYPFTLVGAFGFYSQLDTILAYNADTKSRYQYKAEKSSGLSFGLGIEYPLNDEYSISAIIHNKRGFVFRVIYYFL